MADIVNKAGTNVGNGYKLIGASPLDVRLVVADIAERDSIVTANGCYPGLEVWVESEKKKYRAIPSGSSYTWKEMAVKADINDGTLTLKASTELTATQQSFSANDADDVTFEVKHNTSGVTAGTYGPSEDVTQGTKETKTISVPTITVNEYGHITSITNKTLSVCDTDTDTDTGATSVETVGDGNAVTTASYNADTRKLTLTKGNTFVDLSSTQTITGGKLFNSTVRVLSDYFKLHVGGSDKNDSWFLFTDDDSSKSVAFGIRRPYASYGFQIRERGYEDTDVYKDILRYRETGRSAPRANTIPRWEKKGELKSTLVTIDDSNNITATKFITSGSSDQYVVLGDGSTKSLEEIYESATGGVDLSNFVTINGEETITGKKTFTAPVNVNITETAVQDSALKIISTHKSDESSGSWYGRALFGTKDKTVLMGVHNGMCAIGAHGWTDAMSQSGASWEDLYINPDVGAEVYIGGNGWHKKSGVLRIDNSGTIGSACINTGTWEIPSWQEIRHAGNTYTKTEVDNLIAPAMVMRGTLGTGGTKTSLPAADASTLGDMYKVITEGTYADQAAKVGDAFVCYTTDNTTYQWTLIPAGDSDTDTWREVQVDGTTILGTGNSTSALDLQTGDNITLTASGTNGKVTIAAKDTTYGAGAGLTLTNTTFALKNTSANALCQQGNLVHHCIALGFTKATTSGSYISLELYSRAGEVIKVNISSNDSVYSARAVRITDSYSKIKTIYFNSTNGHLYVTTDNYANNLGCKVIACSEDIATPAMTTVDSIPGGSATIDIVSNITGSGTNNYLAKFNGNNTITSGPALTGDGTKFLNDKGEWGTINIPDVDLSGYLPLTAGASKKLTGPLHVGNKNNAPWDTSVGVVWTDDSGNTMGHIGANQNGLGIQSKTETYFRTGGTTRLYLENTTLRPASNKGLSLGTSSYQWNDIYGTTIYQGGTKVAVEGHGHTNMVTGSGLTANALVRGSGDSAIKTSAATLDDSGNMAAKSYKIDSAVTLEYDSGSKALKFVFA